MKLILTKTLWGCDEVAHPEKWAGLLERVVAQGFNAIEIAAAGLPGDGALDEKWAEAVKASGLKQVVQLHTCGYVARPAAAAMSHGIFAQGIVGSEDPKDHLRSFEELTKRAMAMGADRINSHSGRDSWDTPTAVAFVRDAIAISTRLGVAGITTHETHRQRIMWNPFQAMDVMRQIPELRVTADLSHWCCVLERVPDTKSDRAWGKGAGEGSDPEPKGWAAMLELLADRVDLIHARVGGAETPQVGHPASPEVSYEVQEHERWWARILKGMEARGMKEAWVEPEFGAPGYQRVTPFECTPEEDLWEVNGYMAGRVALLYSNLYLSDDEEEDADGSDAGKAGSAREARGGAGGIPAPLLELYKDGEAKGEEARRRLESGGAEVGKPPLDKWKDGVFMLSVGLAFGFYAGFAIAMVLDNRTRATGRKASGTSL